MTVEKKSEGKEFVEEMDESVRGKEKGREGREGRKRTLMNKKDDFRSCYLFYLPCF